MTTELEKQIKALENGIKAEKNQYKKLLFMDGLRSALILNEDLKSAEEISRRIINTATLFLQTKPSAKETEEVLTRMFDAYVTLAPNDFHSFLMALEWNREPSERFYQPRIKILRPVVDAMTDMIVYDKYDTMMLSMPPGVGKSTLGIFFLAWIIGRDPKKCNLAIGYSTPMAKSFFSRISSIDVDTEYTLHTIFPHLNRTYTSAKELELDFSEDPSDPKKPFVSLTCASVEGSLTGRTRCEGVLYCDDLVEGAETAMSPRRLEKLWELYTSNARSRKKQGCKELHIGTRWSLSDPIGKLQIAYAENERCKMISLPALDENGKSNFEYDYGVGFSTEMFEDIQHLINTISWNALYMQKPIEAEGLLFPVDCLKRYSISDINLKTNPPDDIFAFCDVAFGGTDYLSMPILAQWGTDNPIVLDVVFLRGSYEKTEPIVIGKLLQWNVQRVCFESNNGGDFYAKDIKNMLKDRNASCYVTTQRAGTRMSKETRIIQHQPAIKNFVFRKTDDYPEDNMYRNFMQNLITYTAEGTNEHDDAPDSCAGAASLMHNTMRAVIKVVARKFI